MEAEACPQSHLKCSRARQRKDPRPPFLQPPVDKWYHLKMLPDWWRCSRGWPRPAGHSARRKAESCQISEKNGHWRLRKNPRSEELRAHDPSLQRDSLWYIYILINPHHHKKQTNIQTYQFPQKLAHKKDTCSAVAMFSLFPTSVIILWVKWIYY